MNTLSAVFLVSFGWLQAPSTASKSYSGPVALWLRWRLCISPIAPWHSTRQTLRNVEYKMRKVDRKIKCKPYRIKGKCNLIQNKHRKARVQLDPDSGLGLMGQEGAKKRLWQPWVLHPSWECYNPAGQDVHRARIWPWGKSKAYTPWSSLLSRTLSSISGLQGSRDTWINGKNIEMKS